MEKTIGSPEWFRERAKDPLNIIHDRQTSQSREEFIKKYAPEKLAAMNGSELLDNVFGNGSTMLYDLMDDKEKYINLYTSCDLDRTARHSPGIGGYYCAR